MWAPHPRDPFAPIRVAPILRRSAKALQERSGGLGTGRSPRMARISRRRGEWGEGVHRLRRLHREQPNGRPKPAPWPSPGIRPGRSGRPLGQWNSGRPPTADVTLTAGKHTITLTVTNDAKPPETSTDEVTVTVEPKKQAEPTGQQTSLSPIALVEAGTTSFAAGPACPSRRGRARTSSLALGRLAQ